MRLFLQRTLNLSFDFAVATRPRVMSGSIACLLATGALSGCATGVNMTDEQFGELTAEVEAEIEAEGRPPMLPGSTTSSTAGGGGSGSGSGGNTSDTTGIPSSDGIDGFDNSMAVIPSPPLTGGTCSGATAPAAIGDCAAGGTVSVLYTDRSDAANTNQLTMTLSVQNTGGDFPLSDLVIRYWFTADGESDFTADIDYAKLRNGSNVGDSDVCVNFGDQLNSGFADIGFSSGESVNGDGVDQVQVRIHTGNYASLNQGNDFSFMGGANGASNQNIAVYLRGALVSGCEPQ